MDCPTCGFANPAGTKFCGECGGAIVVERACAQCGTTNPTSLKFCRECGSRLAATTASAASATPAEPSAAPLPASFASGRYAVRSFLGEGGRKRVYLAHDTKLDRDVAFAAIKTDGLDADGVTRIRREAQAMGRLGDHPHIVTVFDTGEETGAARVVEPYIVSQYMAGGELTHLIDAAERRRLPIADAVRIATQIAQGLEHAHAHGIVHRDLKPGNIWLTESGVVKIGDFGLALSLDRTRMTMAGTMVGTAAYMPPEQAMGGATTAASDLYALGCVIYEMVTGRPPFVGDDVVAVISQHVNTPPVAPTWHTNECPAGLETLITRLLAKDPAQRPATASEVLQALASVDVQSAPTEAVAPSDEATSGAIYARTFVGREAELKQLQAAFDGALSGQGALMMVVGEPGIGKTTVTEQLLTYVAMRGGRTLVGHCYEEGSLALPYLPFVEAMRSYALVRERDQLQEELGTGAGEVARIVSEIRDRVAVELPPPGNPEEERFRLFQAVTAFLRNASAAQALCIVLEDLQDGDKGTMELLVHVARNLSGARLLVVGTYRDVEVDRRHPLSAALADLRRVESFARIPLRGLTPDEVQRMLSNIAGQDVPYVLAEAIYRQTEGNPLFIQEVARYILESGLARREGGLWVAPASLLTQIPEGLRDVIGKRLTRLSEECNRILSIAAVMGRDFSLDVLREVAGVPEEQLLSALEEAIGVSLLEERTEARDVRYRFTHAYFRQTLYGEMIAPRRLRLHNEVAKALERHYASRLDEHAAELAEHFAHSSTEEDLRKAVHYGELAGQRAAAVYAHGEAARLLEQALQVQDVLDPNDGAKRYGLLDALGNALLSAGEPKRVSDEIAPEMFALAERLEDSERAAAAAALVQESMARQDAGPIMATPEWAMWTERLSRHAAPDSGSRVVANVNAAFTHYALRRLEEFWESSAAGLDLARRVGDPDALTYAFFAFLTPGSPPEFQGERLRVAEEIYARPRTNIRPSTLGNIFCALYYVFLAAGQRTRADEIQQELDGYSHRVGDPFVQTYQMNAEAVRFALAGEYEAGLDTIQRFTGTAAGAEPFGQAMAAVTASPALVRLGRYEEALAYRPYWGAFLPSEGLAAYVPSAAGLMDEARSETQRLITASGTRAENDWTGAPTLMSLLATAILTRDTDVLRMLYQRLSGFEDLYSPETLSTVARLLGLAALLLDEPAAARKHLATALVVAARVGDRPETALIRLAIARTLFEHYPDERAEGNEHLNFALAEFQAMKMQPALEEAMRLKMREQGISTISSDIYTSIVAVADSVQRERPDIVSHAAPDGTVTIMFSDIEDSTVLTERLGDQAWQELLRKHNALIREQLRAYDGYEVKTMGDGFMVAFRSAKKGLDCAIAIQHAFDGHNAADGERVKVRIGLHAGEAIKDGDDFYGKNVILASRVAGKAVGGEILVSSLLRQLVESSVGAGTFSEPREVELKGLSGAHTVYAITTT
ncbi:MAG: protein kinase [Chloroflexota bacterium]|nr:protein kinase [Chloroflexota bacterium]